MNRKLNNTLAGLTVSGALLALGLVLAVPNVGPAYPDMAMAPSLGSASAGDLDPAALARLEALGREAEAIAETLEGGADAPSISLPKDDARALPAPSRKRAHRQTLVMPYFSFAPRG